MPVSLHEILNLFSPVSKECVAALERHATSAQYPSGTVIVSQGEKNPYVIFIRKGVSRVFFTRNGREDTICFGSGGDIFLSYHTCVSGEPAALSLQALEDVSLVRIPLADLESVMQDFPELTVCMYRFHMRQMFAFECSYRNRALTTPEERMRNFWDVRNDSLRVVPPNLLMKVSPLKYFAQYLGITPQHLSRLRRKLVGR